MVLQQRSLMLKWDMQDLPYSEVARVSLCCSLVAAKPCLPVNISNEPLYLGTSESHDDPSPISGFVSLVAHLNDEFRRGRGDRDCL